VSENSTSSPAKSARAHRAGAFDIRNFIGALMGIYGVILFITGLVGTSKAEIEQSAGVNVNLWTGIGLVLVSAFFIVWARLRPVIVPADVGTDDDDRPAT